MDENGAAKPRRSRAKIAGVAFLVYLASFGVFLALDDAGMLPGPCPVLKAIYYPLIWMYMTVLFPR
jgi:hypothetical protein